MLEIGSHRNLVTGNFLGVDTDGATVATASTPVFVESGATNNTIGGTSPAARNVMASSDGYALIVNDGTNTVVQGNYLGVNATGTAALGTCPFGIFIEVGTGLIIGGSAPGAGNVINATNTGVQLDSPCPGCASATLQGNLIGTDATGTVPFRTLTRGLSLGTCDNCLIGGSNPGAGNVISSAGLGIFVLGDSTGLVIQGNRIGTDTTGAIPLGNSSGGIEVFTSTIGGTIGGTNAGEGNIIAFNGGFGVGILNGNAWSILGNSIHDNASLGISLIGFGSTGPTPNDPCDTDTGANGRQNYPIITGVSLNAGSVTLTGTLNSGTNSPYRLEFFGNPSCDASGYGQGMVFLGATNVTTTNCDATFTVTFPNAGEYTTFTATATDPDGNTSEFSPCAFASPTLTHHSTRSPQRCPSALAHQPPGIQP
jgi:titin